MVTHPRFNPNWLCIKWLTLGFDDWHVYQFVLWDIDGYCGTCWIWGCINPLPRFSFFGGPYTRSTPDPIHTHGAGWILICWVKNAQKSQAVYAGTLEWIPRVRLRQGWWCFLTPQYSNQPTTPHVSRCFMDILLVGGLEHFFFFHILGIITD